VTEIRSRLFRKSVVALCIACLLAFAQGAVSGVLAADDWPSWPKKTVEPGVEKSTPPPETGAPATGTETAGAAEAGAAAGTKTAAGISAGTIGWIAAGVGVAIAIGIAAGGGGGSSTSNH